MNKTTELYDYYRAKYKSYADGEDKADYNGIMIGVYLALSAVVKLSQSTTQMDHGFLADLEEEALQMVNTAYDDEELFE